MRSEENKFTQIRTSIINLFWTQEETFIKNLCASLSPSSQVFKGYIQGQALEGSALEYESDDKQNTFCVLLLEVWSHMCNVKFLHSDMKLFRLRHSASHWTVFR